MEKGMRIDNNLSSQLSIVLTRMQNEGVITRKDLKEEGTLKFQAYPAG